MKRAQQHGSYVDLTQGATENSTRKHILSNGDMSSGSSFKSKIVCTLGPVSRTVPILEKMLRAGMSIARFNFSHGSHEYHQETLDNLRQASMNTGIMCAILQDTKGPEIRTGLLEHGEPVHYHAGDEITLTTNYATVGNNKLIAVSYPDLAKDVSVGSKILCADGSLTLTVLSCNVAEGTCLVKAENSAKLGERKNMNLPGVNVNLPTITEKDRDDLINWGVKNGVDFIAASFVRKGSDIDYIRMVLGDAASKISIISKVENMEGLDNFEDIVEKSDGVMVARGDLGMEIRMEQIFLAQKRMIKRCNEAGKPVITATQMLESMTGAPRPTRAEATDVANAILDGTDCVMLSGETAAGDYPLEAVACMADICREAEAYIDSAAVFQQLLAHQKVPMNILESLASSSVRSAQKVGARLIVTLAKSGNTSRLIAKYRPDCPVLSVCVASGDFGHSYDPENTARRMLASRGLRPMLEPAGWHAQSGHPQEISANAILYARDTLGLIKSGDYVVCVHRLLGDAIMKIVECP
jgi:pyruvate kinase